MDWWKKRKIENLRKRRYVLREESVCLRATGLNDSYYTDRYIECKKELAEIEYDLERLC